MGTAKAEQFQSYKDYSKTVTILDGQTESEAIDIGGTVLVGFRTDANIGGTLITFKSGDSINGTFLDLKGNDATPAVKDVSVAITATTVNQYGVNATDFDSAQFIKFVSNSAQSGSDTVITLILAGNPA
jgi:hypothetical protein